MHDIPDREVVLKTVANIANYYYSNEKKKMKHTANLILCIMKYKTIYSTDYYNMYMRVIQ